MIKTQRPDSHSIEYPPDAVSLSLVTMTYAVGIVSFLFATRTIAADMDDASTAPGGD